MLVVNGWKVGALRLGMNLSQEALAAKAGISPGQIQRIESGKTKCSCTVRKQATENKR